MNFDLNISCPKCDDCKKAINEQKEKYTSERVTWLGKEITKYITSYPYNSVSKYVSLNRSFLEFAVRSCIEDLARYTVFSNSEKPDRHKEAAYLIKWLTSSKPIQVDDYKNNTKLTFDQKNLLFHVNITFAAKIGLSMLGNNAIDHCPSNYYNYLIYTLKFRKISGRILAGDLYLIEEIAKLKKEKLEKKNSELPVQPFDFSVMGGLPGHQ
jgi:hypothetical protein